MKCFTFALLTLVVLLPVPARAQCEDNADCVEQSRWLLGFAVGYGAKTNPLRQHKDIPAYVLPTVAYYGDKWFFDNGSLGYSLAERDDFSLNLVADFTDDQAFFHRRSPANILFGGNSQSLYDKPPLPRQSAPDASTVAAQAARRFTYLAGVEAYAYNPLGILRFALLQDVFGVHHGMEGQFHWRYRLDYHKVRLGLALFFDWKSQEIVNYYYGVRPGESAYWNQNYRAEDGWNRGAEITARYPITPEWELLMTARYTRLADTIAASPLLEDNHSFAYFAGAAYRF